VSGYGFLALAVLIFGQWKPLRILAAAFFFGFMKAISSSYSGISFMSAIPIPSYVYKMIPYIATLIVLAFSSGRSQAPRAEGIPYDKGRR
jgi:simple sugar transport system permease protein